MSLKFYTMDYPFVQKMLLFLSPPFAFSKYIVKVIEYF